METLKAICFMGGEWHKCPYLEHCMDAKWEGVSQCCDVLLYKALGDCTLKAEMEHAKNSAKKKKEGKE